jgi:hypothetical protein
MARLLALVALLPLAAHADAPAPAEKPPAIVVAFKKGIPVERAEEVLKKLGRPFHSGSDSSRGKVFFYSHGPQYLVDVAKDEQPAFLARAKKESTIAEAWVADWSIQKD